MTTERLRSDDGYWEWDGAQWVPVQQQPQPPAPTPRGSRKPLLFLAAGGALLVGLLAISSAVADSQRPAAHVAQATATPTAQPTATPTPKPSATATPVPTPKQPSQREQALRYTTLASQDSATLGQAMTSIGGSCGGSVAICRGAVQRSLDQTNNFVADLNKTPPPDCLKEVDTQLRLALDTMKGAELMVLTGIDRNDANAIDQGTAQLVQATGMINRVTDLLHRASCPS